MRLAMASICRLATVLTLVACGGGDLGGADGFGASSPCTDCDGGGGSTAEGGRGPASGSGGGVVDHVPLPEPAPVYHAFREPNGEEPSVVSLLETWAERSPGHVQIGTYNDAYTPEGGGEALYYLKVSDNVEVDEDEPEVLINFAIHGDEINTVECALLLLYNLSELYYHDARIATLVDQLEIYVVPVQSPVGFINRSRQVNGLDPNRMYPYPGQPEAGMPLIADAVAFYRSHAFAGTFDVHGGGSVVLMPWGAHDGDLPADSPLPSLAEHLRASTDAFTASHGHDAFTAQQIFDWRQSVNPNFPGVNGGSLDFYHDEGAGISLAVELIDYLEPGLADEGEELDGQRRLFLEMGFRFLEAFVGT
jgi:hypothetical protein